MALHKCAAKIVEDLRNVTPEEAQYIIESIQSIQADKSLSPSQATKKLADLRKSQRIYGTRKMKEMLMDITAVERISDELLSNTRWTTAIPNTAKRLKNMVLSVIEGREANMHTLENATRSALGRMDSEIIRPLRRQFTELGIDSLRGNADFESRLGKVLFTNQLDSGADNISPKINAAAKAIKNAQEQVRLKQNSAGASVMRNPSRIFGLKHNGRNIAKASFEEWSETLVRGLDLEESFGYLRAHVAKQNKGASAEELASLWEKAIEKELRADYDNFSKTASGEFGARIESPSASKIQRMEKGRTYKWDDSDAFLDYNNRFGTGTNIIDSTSLEFKRTGKEIGMMEFFGPNQIKNLDALVRKVADGIGESNTAAITEAALEARKSYSILTGRQLEGYGIPNEKAAVLAGAARSITSMAKLGYSAITAVLDYATTVMHAKSITGNNLFNSMLSSGLEIFRAIPKEGRKAFAEEAMLSLEMFQKELMLEITENSSVARGLTSMVEFFHKASGLEFMTQVMKKANGNLAIQHMNDIVTKGAKTTEQINTLKRYGITDADVKAMKELDTYITPKTIADSDIANKEDILRRYQSFILSSIDHGSPTPTVKTRRQLGMAHARGTLKGEAIRMMAQFKTTIWKVTTDIRERALMTSQTGKVTADMNTIASVAQFAVLSTSLGMLRYEVGKRIRDNDFETPVDFNDPKLYLEGFRVGGSAGIIADFAMPFLNPDLHPLVAKGILGSTAAGPVADSTTRMILASRDLILDKPRSGEKFAKEVKANIPYANLFYVQSVMNYIQKMIETDL